MQAWHHSFNPATADVAMDFDEAANRSFFLALFYHVQGLTRRGLHRTALEVGKLLLALDDEDPLGMSFFLDFLAVCAQVPSPPPLPPSPAPRPPPRCELCIWLVIETYDNVCDTPAGTLMILHGSGAGVRRGPFLTWLSGAGTRTNTRTGSGCLILFDLDYALEGTTCTTNITCGGDRAWSTAEKCE